MGLLLAGILINADIGTWLSLRIWTTESRMETFTLLQLFE